MAWKCKALSTIQIVEKEKKEKNEKRLIWIIGGCKLKIKISPNLTRQLQLQSVSSGEERKEEEKYKTLSLNDERDLYMHTYKRPSKKREWQAGRQAEPLLTCSLNRQEEAIIHHLHLLLHPTKIRVKDAQSKSLSYLDLHCTLYSTKRLRGTRPVNKWTSAIFKCTNRCTRASIFFLLKEEKEEVVVVVRKRKRTMLFVEFIFLLFLLSSFYWRLLLPSWGPYLVVH